MNRNATTLSLFPEFLNQEIKFKRQSDFEKKARVKQADEKFELRGESSFGRKNAKPAASSYAYH